MDGIEQVMEVVRQAREESIQCLACAEFGYAERVMQRLYQYMPPDFLQRVVENFNVCNYERVADLLEHEWDNVITFVRPSADEIEAAKRARDEKSAGGDVG